MENVQMTVFNAIQMCGWPRSPLFPLMKFIICVRFVLFCLIVGASMFKAIEGEVNYKFTQDRNVSMAMQRVNLTNQLWNITLQLNNFNRSSYISE